MVQVPSYGAAPLSMTFIFVRALQVVSMIAVVGMSANFVSEIVGTGIEPPKEVVGTLSVTCIATLYTLVSIPFYWTEGSVSLFVMGGIDGLLLLAFIVVAVTVGKPLSFLNCQLLEKASQSSDASNAYAFIMSMSDNIGEVIKGRWSLLQLAGATMTNCYVAKAIWGLSIALCILFATSALLLPVLFFKNKKAAAAAAKPFEA